MIAAADPAARALGLYPGLGVTHARARVPHLRIAAADPAGDEKGLAALAAWCVRRWSPLVAADPPDGIRIDTTGVSHLFGGESPMLDDVVGRLDAAGITARAAIAETLGAAHAAARFGDRAIAVVPPGGVAGALETLPIAALRLPAEIVDGLRLLGFERIGPLDRTPRAPLVRRFGIALARRLDQAFGRMSEPLAPVRPRERHHARLAFAEPINGAEALTAAIGRLVRALCADLGEAGLGARRLDLVCRRLDGDSRGMRIGTARPSRDPRHLARLLVERLDGLDPGFGIEAMELSAPLVEPLAPRQIAAEPDEERPAADLSELVDVLSNRLGADRLYRAAPVESDWPERSVRAVPPLAPASRTGWPGELPRPGRLLDPPERVEATALLPDHPPVQFVWRHTLHRVRCADGPERVFGEWWRSGDEVAAVRDYFRVEDEAGARFWLFRSGDGVDPASGSRRWYLHGLFG